MLPACEQTGQEREGSPAVLRSHAAYPRMQVPSYRHADTGLSIHVSTKVSKEAWGHTICTSQTVARALHRRVVLSPAFRSSEHQAWRNTSEVLVLA